MKKLQVSFLPASGAAGMSRAGYLGLTGNYPVIVNDVYLNNCLINERGKFSPRRERIQILYGGSGSGKSDFKATELLLKSLLNPYFRCIFARKVGATIRDSQFKLFKDLIRRNMWTPFFQVKESEMDIICTLTGNELLSAGLDNVDKLKSIPDVTDIWLEEPINRKDDSVEVTDFTELNRRLRSPKASNHIHMTFNPISMGTWIYQLLFKENIYNTYALKTTYRDNHYSPTDTHDEFERLRRVDFQEWDIYANGNWGQMKAENRLYSDDAIADIFTNSFIQPTGSRYITADIAFADKDKFVIMVWDGWVVIDVAIYERTEPDEVIRLIEKKAREYGVPGRRVCFDAQGIGNYLKGFLKTAVPFVGSAQPMAEGVAAFRKDIVKKPMYENLRAQCFYFLKGKIDECGIYFAVQSLHLRELVTQELAAIKKAGETDEAKYKIIPKADIRTAIGRSPDLADCLSMRSRFDLIPQISQERHVGSF